MTSPPRPANALRTDLGFDLCRRCAAGPLLERLARRRRLMGFAMRHAQRLERGPFCSRTAREILAARCGVWVGAYSYGECMIPTRMPAGVVIGRYVSMASGVRVFLRNHPVDRLSMHPFFYNAALGFVAADTIETGRLRIEHDAWIGENSIMTPGCRRVGLGAVVGAGAVVTKDVPDFAIVAGNPARIVRFRFDEATQDRIRASRWWDRPIEAIAPHMAAMTRAVGSDASTHPLLSADQPAREPKTLQP